MLILVSSEGEEIIVGDLEVYININANGFDWFDWFDILRLVIIVLNKYINLEQIANSITRPNWRQEEIVIEAVEPMMWFI